MSVPTSGPNHFDAKKDSFRARPKPYSIERRFLLMRAASASLALLLIATVLLWNQHFHHRLGTSLEQLNATLELETQIHAGHETTEHAFWEGYYSKGAGPVHDFEERSRAFNQLLDRFMAFSFPEEDWTEVNELHRLELKFQELTARLMSGRRIAEEDDSLLRAVNPLSSAIEAGLRHLEDAQIQHLAALSTQRNLFSTGLTLLLIVFAGFAVLTSIWFRRAHRNHLWNHLEELHRMVGEVRSGNLNVTGEIPRSVELGSLVGAFLEMAGKVREARESLEEKVLERTAKLEQAQSELLQAAKLASLGQLVSGVAHEINNPLTSILGFSEVLLSRAGGDPAAQGPLRMIRDEAMRLRHLVANLTTFARRAPHRTHRMDLRQVLVGLADLRDYQIQANNISLHMECPAGAIWVIGNSDQLMQVLLNLVLNAEQAVKGCRERGDIWIACGNDGQAAWFSVRDNGSGMTPEVRDHIFDPFFTTRPTGQGTGLGLSISYGIIQQHGGTITVESKVGVGTTIETKIPLAPMEPAQERPPDSRSAARRTNGDMKHALVIDDEQGILEMVSDALERVNCRATLVLGSVGVKAALEQEEFDLVICDLKMPGQNGVEVYRMIREMRPELAARFILMTGNLADAEQHTAELAAVSLLPKPFTLAQLRGAVEELLRKAAAA
jgi:signal transduction histidine kinase/ActR/RegA family two-component response regulator